jgi:hypothetical protein
MQEDIDAIEKLNWLIEFKIEFTGGEEIYDTHKLIMDTVIYESHNI